MEEKIELFISKHTIWKEELVLLRQILLKTSLVESIKWGIPTYECNGQNVISLGAFKKHIGIWFHQGVLLSDPKQILINAQKGKTKAMRSIRITKDDPIKEKLISQYIDEAIINANNHRKIVKSPNLKEKNKEVNYPKILKEALSRDKDLKSCLDSLTIIQQYDYAQYITSAKRASTKVSRLNKIIPIIKARKPLSAMWVKK